MTTQGKEKVDTKGKLTIYMHQLVNYVKRCLLTQVMFSLILSSTFVPKPQSVAKMTTNCNSYGSDSVQLLIIWVYIYVICNYWAGQTWHGFLDYLCWFSVKSHIHQDFWGVLHHLWTGVPAPFVLLRIILNEPVCLSGFIFAARGLFENLNTFMMWLRDGCNYSTPF